MFNLLDGAISPIEFVLDLIDDFAFPLAIIGLILIVVMFTAFACASYKRKKNDKNIENKNDKEDDNG